jgi:hypothetical protein
MRKRTSYGFICLATHYDRAADRGASEELEIFGNMPQKSVVSTYGIIVGYCYNKAFFHYPLFYITLLASNLKYDALYGHRRWDARVWVVVDELEVFVSEVEYAIHLRVNLHLRQGARLTA